MKSRVRESVAMRPLQAACSIRRGTKMSVVNGGGGRVEMDAIGSTVTDTDIAVEVPAGSATESGEKWTGMTKMSRGLDGTEEDTGAGAQVEMEIDTDDTNAGKDNVVGAEVVIIGDVAGVEMEGGTKTSIAEGPLRGGGAQALDIGGDAETAWIRLAV